jgi:ubiquinol-cytochrome c reductase cytochrome b subunit
VREHDEEPAPRDRWPNFGLLALVVAAGGLATGVFLGFNYAPTLDAARDSVRYIQDEVTLGWLLRGLHHWAGNLALVLAAVHGWRIFWHGAYKAPRRLLWTLGGAIFLVLLGFAYTGYLLPGDERAYTGLGVMEGIAGSTPGAGEEIRAVLKGGDALSSAMLARVYTVHTVILPAALLGLAIAFVTAWRRRGPARHHADERDEVAPTPFAALKRDAYFSVLVLAVLALLAWLLPPALGPKLDAFGAGAPDAKPEWFFLWVNEALRLAGGHTFLIGAVLPGALVLLAFGLPLVLRGPARDPRQRKPEIVAVLLVLVAIGGLTVSSLATRAAAASEPAPAAPAAGDLDGRAAQVLEKFKCRSCHVIDGGESDQESGPPLTRRATADLPAFGALYQREFFRRKVGDPKKFWAETSMRYTPKRLKPTPDELAVLERWFFLDEEK